MGSPLLSFMNGSYLLKMTRRDFFKIERIRNSVPTIVRRILKLRTISLRSRGTVEIVKVGQRDLNYKDFEY